MFKSIYLVLIVIIPLFLACPEPVSKEPDKENEGVIIPPNANISITGDNYTPSILDEVVLSYKNNQTEILVEDMSFLWIITKAPEGSNAKLSTPNGINTKFVPDLLGDYKISLQITVDGKKGEPQTVDITVNPPVIIPKVQLDEVDLDHIFRGEKLDITGSVVSEDNGLELAYSWSITSSPDGSKAVIEDVNSLNTAFTPDLVGNYSLKLIVSDPYQSAVPVNFDFEVKDFPSVPLDNLQLNAGILADSIVDFRLSGGYENIEYRINDGEWNKALLDNSITYGDASSSYSIFSFDKSLFNKKINTIQYRYGHNNPYADEAEISSFDVLLGSFDFDMDLPYGQTRYTGFNLTIKAESDVAADFVMAFSNGTDEAEDVYVLTDDNGFISIYGLAGEQACVAKAAQYEGTTPFADAGRTLTRDITLYPIADNTGIKVKLLKETSSGNVPLENNGVGQGVVWMVRNDDSYAENYRDVAISSNTHYWYTLETGLFEVDRLAGDEFYGFDFGWMNDTSIHSYKYSTYLDKGETINYEDIIFNGNKGGDITVTVQDVAGNPVEGAKVWLRQFATVYNGTTFEPDHIDIETIDKVSDSEGKVVITPYYGNYELFVFEGFVEVGDVLKSQRRNSETIVVDNQDSKDFTVTLN